MSKVVNSAREYHKRKNELMHRDYDETESRHDWDNDESVANLRDEALDDLMNKVDINTCIQKW